MEKKVKQAIEYLEEISANQKKMNIPTGGIDEVIEILKDGLNP